MNTDLIVDVNNEEKRVDITMHGINEKAKENNILMYIACYT